MHSHCAHYLHSDARGEILFLKTAKSKKQKAKIKKQKAKSKNQKAKLAQGGGAAAGVGP